MNIRKIVTFNALRRQFTPEEQVLADTLYNTTESEREMIVESLNPTKGTGKGIKKTTKKTGSASKSPRASGMATAINNSLRQRRSETPESDDPNEHCQKEFEGGFICDEAADANVHHLSTATGFHEFVAGKSHAVSAGGSSE